MAPTHVGGYAVLGKRLLCCFVPLWFNRLNPPCPKRCREIAVAWEVSAKCIARPVHDPATTTGCHRRRVRSHLPRCWQSRPNHCECPRGWWYLCGQDQLFLAHIPWIEEVPLPQ